VCGAAPPWGRAGPPGYQLWVTAPDGAKVPLIDGGAFDWLARLAANRRAVYVASGTGAQRIAIRFRVG